MCEMAGVAMCVKIMALAGCNAGVAINGGWRNESNRKWLKRGVAG